PLVSEEVRDGRRLFTFAVSGGQAVKFQREPARRVVEEGVPPVAEITSYLTVRPRVEEINVSARFLFPGMERRRFTIALDADLKLQSWGIAGLQDIVVRREGNRQYLDIALTTPQRDEFSLKLDLTRTQTAPEGDRSAPFVGADASRVERHIGLRKSSTVQVALLPAGQNEVERRPDSGSAGLGLWLVRGQGSIAYHVDQSATGVTANLEIVYQVGTEKLEVLAAVTLKKGRLPLQETYLQLPAGFEVQSLQGPAVKTWQRDNNGVFIQFDASEDEETRFVINAAQPRAAATLATTPLPAVFIEGAQKQGAVVLLATHAATDIRMASVAGGGWREFDPSTSGSVFTVMAPWVVKRGLKWETVERANAALGALPAVSLFPQPPRFGANSVLLAQATDAGLLLSQQVGVQMDQGVLKELKLSLPASLPEAMVRGDGVRDAQSKLNGDKREYTVTFQGEVMTSAAVTLDWELPLDGAPVLPLVTVDGAARFRRFFIVDNASASEVKTSTEGVDETVGANLPYLPTALGQAQYYQARGDAAQVKLAFSRTETTAGNAAIVTLAEITSALRPNGERWETVVYSLANRSLQFLPLRLPKGAELIAVKVGEERVRADLDERDGKPLFLIPLIQMRPGEMSQKVSVTYFIPATGKRVLKGRTALDDPELVGLSAERTLWNIWVPDNFDVTHFDGNMEEVVEEIYEDEKAQQKLSDATRLNRIASSKGVSDADAQEALGNARRQLQELREYQHNKTSAPSRGSAPRKKGGKADAADDSMAKNKSNQEIESQLAQQGMVLDINSDLVQNRTVAGAVVQSQGQAFDPPQIPQAAGLNTWKENRIEQPVFQGNNAQMEVNLDNSGVNDNVAVSNGFFAQQVQNKKKSTLEDKMTNLPFKGATLGRANAYNNAAPQAQSDAPAAGQQVLNQTTGTLNIEGFNSNFSNGMGVAGEKLVPLLDPNGTPMGQTPLKKVISTSSSSAISLPSVADPFAPAPESAELKAMKGGLGTLGASGGLAASPEKKPEVGQKVAEVEAGLQKARSLFSTGDFDGATQAFDDVLRRDPVNSAARRGMEQAEQKRGEYFDTARDHQRSRMLNEASGRWEERRSQPQLGAAVDPFAAPSEASHAPQPQQLKPAGRLSLPIDVPLTGTVYHFRKLKDHAQVEFKVSQPWEPSRTAAVWGLGVGLLVLGGVEKLLRLQRSRRRAA
ncbi:MAG: hypothetical protein ACAI34_19625, partial [Verrucomicrobium sp.]|nr:hypothetical protein [Verrucomicrobium sp.]